jgi:TonB family protein
MRAILFNRQLEERRGLFLQIGLTISLFIVWVALQLSFTYTLPEVRVPEEIIEPYMVELPVALPAGESSPAVKPQPVVKPAENTLVIITTADHTETEKVAEQPRQIQGSETTTSSSDSSPVIFIPPIAPEFTGGMEVLYAYLRKNIKYDRRAVEAGIAETVYVRFWIDVQGKVSQVAVVKGVHPWFNQKAVRVVSNMPAWIPGKNYDGSPPGCYFNRPVVFRLQ